MVYNGSIGSVVGLQTAMLPDGTAIVAFTVDRDPITTKPPDYEMAYRVIGSDGRHPGRPGGAHQRQRDRHQSPGGGGVSQRYGLLSSWAGTAPRTAATSASRRWTPTDSSTPAAAPMPSPPASTPSPRRPTWSSAPTSASPSAARSSMDGLTLVWAETGWYAKEAPGRPQRPLRRPAVPDRRRPVPLQPPGPYHPA